MTTATKGDLDKKKKCSSSGNDHELAYSPARRLSSQCTAMFVDKHSSAEQTGIAANVGTKIMIDAR